jgi:hypothetical protein
MSQPCDTTLLFIDHHILIRYENKEEEEEKEEK